MARIGLSILEDTNPEKTDEEKLLELVQGIPAGFEKRLTPEGDPYYVPTGLSQPDVAAPELPIPPVSLPDVPKEPITEPEPLPPAKPLEAPTRPTVYDVTTPNPVPETPNEQLEKLKPPETTEPAQPEPAPEPQPITEPDPMSKAIETLTKGFFGIRKATEPIRQVIAKPAGAIAALPWMIPAGFEAIRGLQHHDEAERKLSQANAAWLEEQGLGAYRGVHKIVGAETVPETGVEHVAGSLASSVVPGSKAATGALFGVNELMRYLKGEPATMTPEEKRLAEARGRVPKWLAEQLLSTPAGAGEVEDRAAALERLKQGQGIKLGPPTGAVPTTPKPGTKAKKGPTIAPVSPEDLQAQPVAPGKVPPPVAPLEAVQPESILRRPTFPKQRKNESAVDYRNRVEQYNKLDVAWRAQFNPSATVTMNTVGGMKEVKESDLWGMGIMAIGTAGMVALPYIYRAMRQAIVPKPISAEEAAARARPVPGAAPGTITNVGPLDVMRASTLDVNLAVVRQANKAMMNPGAVDTLEQMLRSGGHTQGQALIDSAIKLGELRTNTMHFQTPNSLDAIGRAIQQFPNKNGSRYLIVRDILERITAEEAQVAKAGNQATQELGKQFAKTGKGVDVTTLSPKAGPDAEIRINGLTKQEAIDYQTALEQMHGQELVDLGKAWDRWNIDKRKFMADGESGTLSKIDMKNKNIYNKSEIPWGNKVGKDTPFDDRVNHTDILDAQNYRSRNDFKDRMQNEIRRFYVDKMRALDEGYFVRISEEEFNRRPEYRPYTVEVYRRGQRELYTTDRTTRDFLNLDPYIIEGGFPQALNTMKRSFETVFTGYLNPAFSIKNALRVWHTAKQTAIEGRSTPSIYGMAKAVPEQVYPQLGKFLAEHVEDGGGKRLSQFFGRIAGMDPAQSEIALQALGRRWAAAFDDSTYAMIEKHGGSRGSLMEQQYRTSQQAKLGLEQGDSKMSAAGEAASKFWDHFKGSYKTIISSVHEAPQFNYVKQNMGKGVPLDQLIAEARNLGGDPKIGGQYRFSDQFVGAPGKQRPIAFEGTKTQEALVKWGVRPIAGAAEVVRAGPWGNAIMQSVDRVAQAYLTNPALFTAKMYAYSVAPSAMAYMWNYQNGLDPRGKSYADYNMNGRSKYDTMTNMYLAVPGSNAEDGIRIPIIGLEFSLPWVMTQIAMDHMFGQNKLDLKADMKQALWAAADISVNVPLNPVIGLWEISHGRVPPMNLIGGEGFKPNKDPYDQFRSMPESIERYVRQLGGIGSAVGEGWAAYSHTDEGALKAIKNGLGAAAMTQVRQVPIMNTLFDAQPKISGSNKITEEYFSKMKDIDTIVKHYTTKFLKAGMINVDPASKLGGEAATKMLGPTIPPITPGPPQPEPNDPEYLAFMSTLYARFKRDNPGYSQKGEDLGGTGFISILRRWGDASAAIRSMEYVDQGLHPQWQRWLNDPKNEDLKTWLKDANVDQTNIRAVKNVFEEKRQAAGLTLLYYINAVEKEFTDKRRAGDPLRGIPPNPNAPPFSIDELKPYSPLGQFGTTPSQFGEAFSGAGMPE